MDKTALETEIRRLQNQKYKIENAERRKANSKLIGKTFRYRNSYGGTGRDWWLYARVIKIDQYGSPVCFRFQTDCDGKIEIDQNYSAPYTLNGGYQEITKTEFRKAWRVVKNKIKGIV